MSSNNEGYMNVVRRHADIIVTDIAHGLDTLLSGENNNKESNNGRLEQHKQRQVGNEFTLISNSNSNGSFMFTEKSAEAQEATIALHSIITTFFTTPAACTDDNQQNLAVHSIEVVGRVLLKALRCTALFTRKALVTAASTLAILSLVPLPLPGNNNIIPMENIVVAQFAQSLGISPLFSTPQHAQHDDNGSTMTNQSHLHQLQQLDDIGRMCSIQGYLEALPSTSFLLPIKSNDIISGNNNNGNNNNNNNNNGNNNLLLLLTDGLMPLCCTSVLYGSSSQVKVCAMSTLLKCLEITKEILFTIATATAGDSYKERLLDAFKVDRVMSVLVTVFESQFYELLDLALTVFQALLDAVEALDGSTSSSNSSNEEKKGRNGLLMSRVIDDLLHIPPTRKARYAPMSILISKLGAHTLLQLHPDLIAESIQAIEESSIRNAVASMLGKLWLDVYTSLIVVDREGKDDDDGDDAPENDTPPPPHFPLSRNYKHQWEGCWLDDIVKVLCCDDEKLSNAVSTFLLPKLFAINSQAIGSLLAHLSSSSFKNKNVSCLAVLKAGRRLRLVTDFNHIPGFFNSCTATEAMVEELLLSGIRHQSEAARLDALEVVCGISKTSNMLPSDMELRIALQALQLYSRCTGASFRGKMLLLFQILLIRVRRAVAVAARPARKQGQGKEEEDGENEKEVRRLERWLYAVQYNALLGLYPGAPFERKMMSVEVLTAMFDCFGDCIKYIDVRSSMDVSSPCIIQPRSKSQKGKTLVAKKDGSGTIPPTSSFSPVDVSAFLYNPQIVNLLLSSSVDSFTRIRQCVFEILAYFPSPLPGYEEREVVEGLVQRGRELLFSPRAQENEAGARLLQLLMTKYCCGSPGWQLNLHNNSSGDDERQHNTNTTNSTDTISPTNTQADAALRFIQDCCTMIDDAITNGHIDLFIGSTTFLAHGPLLLLKYLIPAFPWSYYLSPSPSSSQQHYTIVRSLLDRIIAVLHKAAELVLPVVANPEADSMGEEDVDVEIYDMSSLLMTEEEGGKGEGGGNNATATNDANDATVSSGEVLIGPKTQIIMCACWKTMKQVTDTVATLVNELPLCDRLQRACRVGRGNDTGDDCSKEGGKKKSSNKSTPKPVSTTTNSNYKGIITFQDLKSLGSFLVSLLCQMKQNGANDRAAIALSEVCTGCFVNGNTEINTLPKEFYNILLQHMCRPGQGRNDIARKSAGLTLAFHAIMEAEVVLFVSDRQYLSWCLKQLLTIARNGVISDVDDSDGDNNGKGMKIGQWPRIHAFNALRGAFLDISMAAETLHYSSEGMQTVLNGLAAEWEVRNAASLAFSALLIRIMGFANVIDSHTTSLLKAMTADDMFLKFPDLYGCLLSELTKAVDHMLQVDGERRQALHPSLQPVLLLLARVRPPQSSRLDDTAVKELLLYSHGYRKQSTDNSTIAAAEQRHSSILFIPLVKQCAAVSSEKVRRLAARALSCLVPQQDLAVVVKQLTKDITTALASSSVTTLTTSLNELHGWLLQLNALLTAYTTTTTSSSSSHQHSSDSTTMTTDIAPLIFEFLLDCLPLLRVVHCACAPITVELLSIATTTAPLLSSKSSESAGNKEEEEDEEDEYNILIEAMKELSLEAIISSSQLEGERADDGGDWKNPMVTWAYKQATQLYFTLIASSPPPQPVRVLVCSVTAALASRKAEVRASALKMLIRLIEKRGDDGVSTGRDQRQDMLLLHILVRHIDHDVEKHYKVVRRALHCISLLILPSIDNNNIIMEDDALLSSLFQSSLHHVHHSSDSETRCYAIICLGELLNKDNTTSTSTTSDGGITEKQRSKALKAMELCGDASELDDDVRYAGAQSLASSGLLLIPQTTNTTTSTCNNDNTTNNVTTFQEDGDEMMFTRAWSLAFYLMEDEEEAVQTMAARGVSRALGLGSSNGNGDGTEYSVDHIERIALPILAQKLTNSKKEGGNRVLRRVFVQLLKRWIRPDGNNSSAVERSVVNSGRLFHIEPDNRHIEPLLLSQLAAAAILQIVHYDDDDGDECGIHQWADCAAKKLKEMMMVMGGDNNKSLVESGEALFFQMAQCCLAVQSSDANIDGGLLPFKEEGGHFHLDALMNDKKRQQKQQQQQQQQRDGAPHKSAFFLL
jgi:hypothetical protein